MNLLWMFYLYVHRTWRQSLLLLKNADRVQSLKKSAKKYQGQTLK